MKKELSVIIPCYNVENFIERCFTSLIQQTIGIEQLELIFVDDASTDNTLLKLKSYEQQYPESIILIPLSENQLQGAARNIAMEYASAPYISYIDADDWVESDMFSTMLSAIKHYKCDFVECNWDFFDGISFQKPNLNTGTPGFLDFSNYNVKAKYITEQLTFTSMCNKLFKKDFLLEHDIFCPEGLRYEDIFFCYLTFLYTKSYFHVGKTFYHYFVNPNGTVQNRTASYQLDKMDISLGFLSTCKERGLMAEYKELIEWMFLEKYYIYMIWEILEIFPEKAYDYYLNMKQVILKLVPDYKSNPFRQLESNHPDSLILKLIDYPLNKEQFMDLMRKLWLQLKVATE